MRYYGKFIPVGERGIDPPDAIDEGCLPESGGGEIFRIWLEDIPIPTEPGKMPIRLLAGEGEE